MRLYEITSEEPIDKAKRGLLQCQRGLVDAQYRRRSDAKKSFHLAIKKYKEAIDSTDSDDVKKLLSSARQAHEDADRRMME